MLVQRWTSNISYNTDNFLISVLNELLNERKIQFWAYINHYAEQDEKKPHKHLIILPNGRLNTDILDNRFLEMDITHPDKPLRCKIWQSTQFSSAYLYMIHDEKFLLSKGLVRRYHYNIHDIICSDFDFLIEMTHTINYAPYKRIEFIKDAVIKRIPFCLLCEQGLVPIAQYFQYRSYYNSLSATYQAIPGGKGKPLEQISYDDLDTYSKF